MDNFIEEQEAKLVQLRKEYAGATKKEQDFILRRAKLIQTAIDMHTTAEDVTEEEALELFK